MQLPPSKRHTTEYVANLRRGQFIPGNSAKKSSHAYQRMANLQAAIAAAIGIAMIASRSHGIRFSTPLHAGEMQRALSSLLLLGLTGDRRAR